MGNTLYGFYSACMEESIRNSVSHQNWSRPIPFFIYARDNGSEVRVTFVSEDPSPSMLRRWPDTICVGQVSHHVADGM